MQRFKIQLYVLILPVALLTGCGILKGDNCDCPKFSFNRQLTAPEDMPVAVFDVRGNKSQWHSSGTLLPS